MIRVYLQNINKDFFRDENKGFQSWCADMWAVLWNVWLREKETKNIPEMEFCWSSDPIEKLERTTLLHNAGITGQHTMGWPAFYKGTYINGKDPFKDTHLYIVDTDDTSKKHANHYYLKQLLDLKQKYNLNY